MVARRGVGSAPRSEGPRILQRQGVRRAAAWLSLGLCCNLLQCDRGDDRRRLKEAYIAPDQPNCNQSLARVKHVPFPPCASYHRDLS
jgi:hypothetical protein